MWGWPALGRAASPPQCSSWGCPSVRPCPGLRLLHLRRLAGALPVCLRGEGPVQSPLVLVDPTGPRCGRCCAGEKRVLEIWTRSSGYARWMAGPRLGPPLCLAWRGLGGPLGVTSTRCLPGAALGDGGGEGHRCCFAPLPASPSAQAGVVTAAPTHGAGSVPSRASPEPRGRSVLPFEDEAASPGAGSHGRAGVGVVLGVTCPSLDFACRVRALPGGRRD